MEKLCAKKVKVEDAITAFGGASKLANYLGVSRSAISQYKRHEFLPELRAWQVCKLMPELNSSEPS